MERKALSDGSELAGEQTAEKDRETRTVLISCSLLSISVPKYVFDSTASVGGLFIKV